MIYRPIINRHMLRQHCRTLNYSFKANFTSCAFKMNPSFSNICIIGFELYIFVKKTCKFRKYYLIFLFLTQFLVICKAPYV